MRILDLMDSPDKWTRGMFASDKNGNECDNNSPRAVARCLVGWFRYCYLGGATYGETAAASLHKLRQAIREYSPCISTQANFSIIAWQDSPSRTFEDIRAVVEIAQI